MTKQAPCCYLFLSSFVPSHPPFFFSQHLARIPRLRNKDGPRPLKQLRPLIKQNQYKKRQHNKPTRNASYPTRPEPNRTLPYLTLPYLTDARNHTVHLANSYTRYSKTRHAATKKNRRTAHVSFCLVVAQGRLEDVRALLRVPAALKASQDRLPHR